jgi:hypothetical protein
VKNRAAFILPVVFILLIALGIFAWIETESFSDFGLNFATETIGVLITVYIVDFLLKSREQARLAPMRIIVFQEICALSNRFMGLIFELYSESEKEPPPDTVKAFIKDDCIYRALLHASIDDRPRVSPPQTMAQYLSANAMYFEKSSEQILLKYSNFMSPKTANILHKVFVESAFVAILKTLPKTVQQRQNLPYPKSLIYHLYNPDDKDKNNLILLNSWLEKERSDLLSIESDLRKLSNPKYLNNRSKEHKYIYRISDADLEKQVREFEKWKATNVKRVHY